MVECTPEPAHRDSSNLPHRLHKHLRVDDAKGGSHVAESSSLGGGFGFGHNLVSRGNELLLHYTC